jgi:hypothetical protein
MKRKRIQKSVITTETHQVTIVHPPHKAIRGWCERCGAEVDLLTPDRAARLLGLTSREIYRRVESGAVHFVEIEGGALLICCRSGAPAGWPPDEEHTE